MLARLGQIVVCTLLVSPVAGGQFAHAHDGSSRYHATMVPSPELLSRLVPYPDWQNDNASLGYEAATGRVWIDPPPERMLTSLSITSQPDVFTGEPPKELGGSFDLFGPQSSSPCGAYAACGADLSILFKVTLGDRFGSLDFGNVARPELDLDFLLSDWFVTGSLAGGGVLGEVNLVYVRDLVPGDANQDFVFDQLMQYARG